MAGFVFGVRCLLRGFGLMWMPELRRWALMPMLLSVAVYVGLFWMAAGRIDSWVESAAESLPGWLSWLADVLWFVLWCLAILLMTFTFAITASLVASPFNGPLAARTERVLTGRLPPGAGGGVLMGLPRLVSQETGKLLYAVVGSIPFLLLFLVPVVDLVAPVLWFLWSGWVTALAFTDYALDANGLHFRDMRRLLGRRRGAAWGFGAATLFALTIPGLNIIAVPAAVCGGTVLWVEGLSALHRDR